MFSMAINIVEAVQAKLGTRAINKINVNATHQSETQHPASTDHGIQGAAAAVLAALYRYGKTDEGAANLARGGNENWLQPIFLNKQEVAIDKVAKYSDISTDDARTNMTNIADIAVQEIHRNAGNNPTPEKVKAYIASQRHNIVQYLPAELEMGKLLNDPVLDDRTNKMEGPVSSFMAWIQDLMSPEDHTNEEAFRRNDEMFPRKNR
jgi:hypothetical protein